jgi:hypothetical protein
MKQNGKQMCSSKSLLLFFLVFFFLVFGLNAVFAQSNISDPGAKQICASVKDVPLPAADRPTAAEQKELAHCSSADAFYGFGQPADFVKARKCAYDEIARGDKTVLGGKAILMMIYANGKGVPKNYDVALNLACSLGDAPGDAAGRVYEINRLKTGNMVGGNVSICDHSSGRVLYEQCAILGERFDKIARDKKLAELASSWSERDKKALHVLWEEVERFSREQANDAINLEPTFEVQEEAALKEHALSMLEQLERGELPQFSTKELLQAEAAEKAAYDRTQHGTVSKWGTVTSDSVKKSEEEWLRYCDAWLTFGKQRYPKVSQESWKTWLNQERAYMLNKLLH